MTSKRVVRAVAAERHNDARVSLPRRMLRSIWLRAALFVAALLVLATLFMGHFGSKVSAEQTEFLANAVRRSAVQCYALEGRFPTNLAYLEQEYGLIIDHQNYAVYYEPMGENLIPQIRVMAIAR